MRGRAIAFGAVSIVNAIASGKGATAGVKLKTEAEVEVRDEPGTWNVIVNGELKDSRLAIEVVKKVLNDLGKNSIQYSGTIETKSEIPIGVGLKSSSSSSIAVALATLSALGYDNFETERILRWSVEASIASGDSITGALDDAASCLLGGINHADNLNKIIMSSKRVETNFKVMIRIPSMPSRRMEIDLNLVRKFSKLTDSTFEMSHHGDNWNAMTLNGIIYSSIFGYDPISAIRAIESGALGAGLSGTGPSVAAVFDTRMKDSMEFLKKEWMKDGSMVIETETNNQAGGIIAND
jgi:shikimate kinase